MSTTQTPPTFDAATTRLLADAHERRASAPPERERLVEAFFALASVAGAFVGTAIADAMFDASDGFGDEGGGDDADGSGEGDYAGGEDELASGGYAGDYPTGGGDDGGDFGGGDFGGDFGGGGDF